MFGKCKLDLHDVLRFPEYATKTASSKTQFRWTQDAGCRGQWGGGIVRIGRGHSGRRTRVDAVPSYFLAVLYTLLDEKTNLIIELSLVQVTEVTSSNAMEYEGCKRTLNSMIKKKIPIRRLTTERHTTISAKMRSNYPTITHQYDVWHISKWITKKLTKKAKKKGCEELLPWIRSVSNHFWWSAATCDKNADILREKWLSVLYHITGKYRWKTSEDFKNIKKCGHPSISRKDQKSIKWLEAGSPAHIASEEVVTNNKLLKDICKLTEFHNAGQLESYHSLRTKYVPEREHFCYNGIVARTQLALVDHNNNVNRS